MASTITELLEDIKNMLAKISQRDDDLWTLEDIANYMKTSTRSVNRMMQLETFPAPVRLPTTENGGRPRWFVGEIKQFVKRYRS